MQAVNKVLTFKPSGKMPYRTIIEKVPAEPLSSSEEKRLLEKALNVLDEAEGEWEMDHKSPYLRDKFHLLRHYLKRMQQF